MLWKQVAQFDALNWVEFLKSSSYKWFMRPIPYIETLKIRYSSIQSIEIL